MRSKLEELQQCAIQNVIARTSEANTASTAIRVGGLNGLHIAAYMEIEKTTESLNHILLYKKEVANRMLRCSDEKLFELYAEMIKQADDMIRKVLGMYMP